MRRATRGTAVSHRSSSGRARMPSTYGYMLAAAATAAALFFLLWWMLHTSGDEAPWVPAGLAASVVMLVAIAAREVVMRRAWTRYILEHDRRDRNRTETTRRSSSSGSISHGSSHQRTSSGSVNPYSAMLRALQKQCAEADAHGSLPEAHLEAYLSCQDYLETSTDALRSASANSDTRVSLRAGQERVRSLARHHMLAWARVASRALTHEAQTRVRMSDKIETATRALDVIESAIRLYPDETELRDSQVAVREYISSVKVSHWVELAERAAFKGQFARAIDRYRDALFYLMRAQVTEEARHQTASRIEREIDLLRARLKTGTIENPRPHSSKRRAREKVIE